jgi:hypothetical protein
VDESDIAIVGAVVAAVVQALKPLRVDSAFLPVIAIVVGLVSGAGIGYARRDVAGIADGALTGIVAALATMGAYSGSSSMARYARPPREEQPRDERGRYVSPEETRR